MSQALAAGGIWIGLMFVTLTLLGIMILLKLEDIIALMHRQLGRSRRGKNGRIVKRAKTTGR